MITSCICHGCPWQDLELEGKNSYQHYGAWLNGETATAQRGLDLTASTLGAQVTVVDLLCHFGCLFCCCRVAVGVAGKTTGAASIHIDPRLPNGGGDLKFTNCKPFPAQH